MERQTTRDDSKAVSAHVVESPCELLGANTLHQIASANLHLLRYYLDELCGPKRRRTFSLLGNSTGLANLWVAMIVDTLTGKSSPSLRPLAEQGGPDLARHDPPVPADIKVAILDLASIDRRQILATEPLSTLGAYLVDQAFEDEGTLLRGNVVAGVL